MKSTLWIGTLVGGGLLVGGTLLIAGCGKAPTSQPAVPAAQRPAETTAPPAAAVPVQAKPAAEPAERPAAAEGGTVADRRAKQATEETTTPKESESSHPKEKVTEKSGKPSVLGAVGRALLNSFKSDSHQPPPSEAPTFRSQH